MRPEKKKYNNLRGNRRSLKVLERDKGIHQNGGKSNFEVGLQAHQRNYNVSDPWDEAMENLVRLRVNGHPIEPKNLGTAARGVASALLNNHWRVKHRRQLQRCIEESIISPEEIHQIVDERNKKRGRQ
jgi:hypothetical protein